MMKKEQKENIEQESDSVHEEKDMAVLESVQQPSALLILCALVQSPRFAPRIMDAKHQEHLIDAAFALADQFDARQQSR